MTVWWDELMCLLLHGAWQVEVHWSKQHYRCGKPGCRAQARVDAYGRRAGAQHV